MTNKEKVKILKKQWNDDFSSHGYILEELKRYLCLIKECNRARTDGKYLCEFHGDTKKTNKRAQQQEKLVY